MKEQPAPPLYKTFFIDKSDERKVMFQAIEAAFHPEISDPFTPQAEISHWEIGEFEYLTLEGGGQDPQVPAGAHLEPREEAPHGAAD